MWSRAGALAPVPQVLDFHSKSKPQFYSLKVFHFSYYLACQNHLQTFQIHVRTDIH